ncbi:hypothetical protein [Corynebacterium kalidii]
MTPETARTTYEHLAWEGPAGLADILPSEIEDAYATIAAQEWEWGRRGGGGIEWHRTEEEARHHVRVAQGYLVRRLVGPVEVVE